MMVRSEEQIFASAISGTPLSEWEPGKKFLAMSDRSMFVFDPSSLSGVPTDSVRGRVLQFAGYESRITPDLKEECVILFSDGSSIYRYNTGRPVAEALSEIVSSKMPLLADVDLAHAWSEKLDGRSLWTKSNLWYDEAGKRKDGLKYVEVKVIGVMPSDGDFPMKVKISRDGEVSYMYMNYTSDIADSRNFAALFFLDDPHARYPRVSDDNWRLIQSGKVGIGMSKEECKLAIGNPDDINAGRTSSQTVDLWQYADGTYLFFTDGILTSFRQ